MVEPSSTSDVVQRRSHIIIQWIRDHSHVNWALFDQGMVSVVNFLTGILLARYLGIAEFGVFTLAWIAVEFTLGIQHSVIIAPMMSIAPKQSATAQPGYYGSVFAQQIAFTLLSFVLYFCGLAVVNTYWPEWNLQGLGLPLAAALVVAQLQNFSRRYFFTKGRVMVAFWLDFVRYAGQLFLLFWLLRTFQMEAGKTLWAISGTAAASAMIGLFFLEEVKFEARAIRDVFVRHWLFSRWMLYSEIVRWGTSNLFIVAAGSVLGPAAVGAIRAAQNLVGLCHVLYLGLENIAPISASRHFSEGGVAALIKYLKRLTLFLATVVGLTLMVAAAAPEFWLELIYGTEYSGYGHLVWWWAFIVGIGIVSVPVVFGLRAIEQTKPIFWAHLVLAVFTVAAAYPMAEYLGVNGVMAGLLTLAVIKSGIVTLSLVSQLRKLRRSAYSGLTNR